MALCMRARGESAHVMWGGGRWSSRPVHKRSTRDPFQKTFIVCIILYYSKCLSELMNCVPVVEWVGWFSDNEVPRFGLIWYLELPSENRWWCTSPGPQDGACKIRRPPRSSAQRKESQREMRAPSEIDAQIVWFIYVNHTFSYIE